MNLNPVITQEDARKITRGRTPLLPIEYEMAVNALQKCIELDEAKQWSDKAEALASWAKIYRSNEAEVKAKRLKLHAFRRMGEIASELRPRKTGKGRGPVSLLVQSGLSAEAAQAARAVASISKARFNSSVNCELPPSPKTLMREIRYEKSESSKSWIEISRSHGSNSLHAARSFCRIKDPKMMARDLKPDEIKLARDWITEIYEWTDAFLAHLPKGKR